MTEEHDSARRSRPLGTVGYDAVAAETPFHDAPRSRAFRPLSLILAM
jgi:hypothetical protein